MNYVEVVNFIFSSLFAFFGFLVLHFLFFGIIGVFLKKEYPEAEKKMKYGIIIPARNEELVVGKLIQSIKKSDYPKDRLEIFLIAHNCTDKTAEIGASLGINVYEYNNQNECTMGYAIRHGFSKIKDEYGIEAFDGYIIFNADNVVTRQYFNKLNNAFVKEGKDCVITTFRNSKNFGESILSAMYGLYFLFGCRFEARGRTVLGSSTRIQGTGYVIPKKLVEDGWNYVTLTEDWEFTADQLLSGTKILYCDDAVFYDEQPTRVSVMWRQRVRWARGHLLVFLSRYKDIIKALFSPNKSHASLYKLSLYDFSVNILPVGIIGVGLAALHFSALLFSPFFGNFDLFDVLFSYVKSYAVSIVSSYFTVIFSALIIYIIERKRIENMKPKILISAILLLPAFILLSAPCDITAMFSKNLGWKTIPHNNKTSIEDLEKN